MSETETGIFSCRNICWIAGALLGLVAFLLIGGLPGLIVGVVLAVAIALLLRRQFCSAPDVAGSHVPTVGRAADVSTGAGASNALSHSESDRAAADAAASAMTGDEEVAASIAGEGGRTTPATALDAAAVKADSPAQTHGGASTPATPKAKAAPKKKAAAPKSSATKSASATAKPAAKPVAADGKPELLSAPQGAADDLKLIKGVGPKIEEKLNALGIWHYSQVAAWRKEEADWVDDQLSFRGRVERDGWIDQAKKLATGEATEFSKRATKTGMYDK